VYGPLPDLPGEHYLIDILLGWAYAAAIVYLVDRIAERRRQRAAAASREPDAAKAPAAAPPRSAEPAGVSR